MSELRPKPGKFVLPTVSTCRYRRAVRMLESGREDALCDLISEASGIQDLDLLRVGADACQACCQSFPPSKNTWNAVIASLLYDLAERVAVQGGVPGCDVQAADELRQKAGGSLDFVVAPSSRIVPARVSEPCCHLGGPAEQHAQQGSQSSLICHHPSHGVTTLEQCRLCRDWAATPGVSRMMTLAELVPPPPARSEARVRTWSVGVLSSPRREATLEWCLDSLVRAGFDDPHLFLDGTVGVPQMYSHLNITWREQRAGAWPNYYLALAEMVLRDPYADAYFLVQDDALLYDRANMREFLESMLWPGDKPSLVSLYCSQAYSATSPGWHVLNRRWIWGALAFIFPRQLAREFISDPMVLRHRWKTSANGRAQVDVLIGAWMSGRNLPIWFPNPSLVQHGGNTSTIWNEARNVGHRCADWFAGDLESPFTPQATLADFPEDHFPCADALLPEYERRIAAGRRRMRQSRVVICGLCRNVRHFLPRLAARVERLGESFQDYRVVLFENDSGDATLEFLHDWRRDNPRVHVLSERLDVPRFPQIRCSDRATHMAKCRNRYRDYAVCHFGDFDFLMVTDTDLAGGWSYDGIANTFGWEEWDFVGSYGLLRRPHTEQIEYVHFDAWAFRMLGHPEPHPNYEVGSLLFRRGEPLAPVLSCFGGLGIYRMEAMRAASYAGPDLEHAVLHERMRRQGFDRLALNPSQITLYAPE